MKAAPEVSSSAWHTLPADAVMSRLSSAPQGLVEVEAERRLAQYGPNELQAADHVSAWAILFEQFKNVLIIILLIGTRLSSIRSQRRNLYLNIQVPEQETASTFETVNGILTQHAQFVDMRRLDRRDHVLHLTYWMNCKDQAELARLMDNLEKQIPESSFSFIDQSNTPG